MAHSLWKGAINFGLVNVPVELYPAEERKEFQFSMLDKRDLSPVGYKRYSKKTGKEVEWNNIIKGYEYDKDRYVVLSDGGLSTRECQKATQTIEIRAFVSAERNPGGIFRNALLLGACGARRKGLCAAARDAQVDRSRSGRRSCHPDSTQHLAMVAPVGRSLMLVTMRYADQLRGTRGLELPAESLKSAGVTGKEVALAKRLVDDMTLHWKPQE